MSEEIYQERFLNHSEKQALLTIARHAIERAVVGTQKKSSGFESPVLEEKRGAFVTIHNQGQLRGCIGYIIGKKALKDTVEEVAQAAALRDSRFEPVLARELSEIDLEISVLTPLREIKEVKEINVGTHGILIQNGIRSGVLLPQVAREYNWDRETFLENTCVKAGLPQDAWREKDTRIYIFSAQVFGENDMH